MGIAAPAKSPDTVARRLQAAIERGEFAAEKPLPSERVLAARWKLSRSMVREGIAMLAAKGLLTRQQGRGTFVSAAEDQPGAQVWAEMAGRHPHLQGDLLEFRHMLECRAAELAARHHVAADRKRLETAGAAVDRAWDEKDRKEQLRTDLALHQCIAEATHNPVFSYLMSSLHRLLLDHMQLSAAGTQANTAVTEQVRAQHRELVRAILARDVRAAGQAAGRHLDFVRERLNHLPIRRGV